MPNWIGYDLTVCRKWGLLELQGVKIKEEKDEEQVADVTEADLVSLLVCQEQDGDERAEDLQKQ